MTASTELEREALLLFEAALDRPSSERASWIEGETAGRDDLRRRALRLLQSASRPIGKIDIGEGPVSIDKADWPERVGAYRIVDLLGEGGMGAVFKAERDTGDFDHEVAIKLIRPGALSDELIARFERERQILASLTHPNIARLYDGGRSDDGTPFIVMELIDGVPIAEWVTQHSLALDARLGLMKQICEAVGFAHQNLIIHRDLTPNNVLVSEDGKPKLIDFGISRPQEDGAGPADGVPAEVQLSLTPGYAAPERHRGAPATTLADIYSLGKLLERLIGDDGAIPDLQAIIGKATAEEPEERYPTARALLRDLERFEQDRPVEAYQAGRGYVLRKFLKRQRVAAALTAAIVIALLGGMIATTIGFQRARVAQAAAEARLADTRDIANLMMFEVFDEVSRVPGTTSARMVIARNAQRYLEQLASDPSAPIETRLAAGRGFHRLASVTGRLEAANLGDIQRGLDLFERSAEILGDVHTEAPDDATALAFSEALIDWGILLGHSYVDVERGIEHLRRANTILAEIDTPSAASVAARLRLQRYLGDYLGCCADAPVEGNAAINEGIAFARAAPQDIRNDPEVRRMFNDLLNLNAGYRIFLGSDEDGIEAFYEVLAAQSRLTRETSQPEDLRLEAIIAHNLARTLARLNRPADAEAVLAPVHTRALAAYEVDRRDNDLQRRIAMISLVRAWVAAERGAGSRAAGYLQDGLRFARMADWPEGIRSVPSLTYAHRLQEASEAAWALHRVDQACNLMRRSTAMYAAYAEQLELPETALRYRLARMTGRMEDCPANSATS